MAVNLSPRQFRNPRLISQIDNVLQQSRVASDRLELEITEGVLMSGYDNIIERLNTMKNMGVRLAMDDFGTGYSSLSYLRNYPFDSIKIDREFISDITENKADQELENTIIVMTHSLRLEVVAEGVETEAQLDHLVIEA